MQVIYFLPKYNYFKEQLRGRTSHAHGFLTGLRSNQIDPLLVSGPGYDELYGANAVRKIVYQPTLISRINFLWVAYCASRLIFNKKLNCKDVILIVRYSKSVAFLTSFLFGMLWKGRTVYEINSLAYHQSTAQSKFYLTMVLALEKKLVSLFDIAICVSENIKLDLYDRNIKVFVMPNGGLPAPIRLKPTARDHVRFVYLGGYQPYYDFAQLFRCFLSAALSHAELHIYGDVTKYSVNFPDFVGCDGIKFKGLYDLNALVKDGVLAQSDIFLLPNGRNRMARIGSPTKLFEYLAFGNRIVYQRYGQAADVLDGLSATFAYEDDDSLVRILRSLADQFDEQFIRPVSVEKYLSTYTWRARVRTFCDFLTEQGKR